MAGLDFQEKLGAFILVGIVIISLVFFGSGMLASNGGTNNLVDETAINLSGFIDSVNQTSSTAENWNKAFTSDNNFLDVGAIVLKSFWESLKGMTSMMFGFIGLIAQISHNVLGIPSLVIGGIIAILIIGILFGAWKVMKTGE
jgi:hypothetical protein